MKTFEEFWSFWITQNRYQFPELPIKTACESAWNAAREPEIKAELPTEPGPYWWREKDGNQWDKYEIVTISGRLYLSCETDCLPLNTFTEFFPIGQWIKIERPEV